MPSSVIISIFTRGQSVEGAWRIRRVRVRVCAGARAPEIVYYFSSFPAPILELEEQEGGPGGGEEYTRVCVCVSGTGPSVRLWSCRRVIFGRAGRLGFLDYYSVVH